jgi:hypothetical protein
VFDQCIQLVFQSTHRTKNNIGSRDRLAGKNGYRLIVVVRLAWTIAVVIARARAIVIALARATWSKLIVERRRGLNSLAGGWAWWTRNKSDPSIGGCRPI